jgi:hypothetical protein
MVPSIFGDEPRDFIAKTWEFSIPIYSVNYRFGRVQFIRILFGALS